MIAVEPILPGHPTAIVLGQGVTALVALVSFWWAYRYTRPKKKITSKGGNSPQRRVNRVEGIVEFKQVCNPGRRGSDRCTTCPHDDTCIKHLGVASESERARDKASTQLVEQAVEHARPIGSVLFVDDNAELRVLAELMLTASGLRVRVCSGVEDLTPIRADEDVLVTDWRLEGDHTGAEVIRAYREVRPDRPVIVVSAMDGQPRNLPYDVAYVRKPFEPDELVHLIQAMLEKE